MPFHLEYLASWWSSTVFSNLHSLQRSRHHSGQSVHIILLFLFCTLDLPFCLPPDNLLASRSWLFVLNVLPVFTSHLTAFLFFFLSCFFWNPYTFPSSLCLSSTFSQAPIYAFLMLLHCASNLTFLVVPWSSLLLITNVLFISYIWVSSLFCSLRIKESLILFH